MKKKKKKSMKKGVLLVLVPLTMAVSCTPHSEKPQATPSASASLTSAPSASPSAIPSTSASPRELAAVADAGVDAAIASAGPLVPDEAFGPLIARLSEPAGDFPSENYVSNETSLLDVAPILRDPKLRGRAYVGVGPEQNYSYLAMLEPKVAYIVDIRRGNLLEHMFFRGCFEAGATRSEFVSALVSRHPTKPEAGTTTTTTPTTTTTATTEERNGFAALDAAFGSSPMNKELRDAGIARTKALMDRLGVAHSKNDDTTITRIQSAFATHGLTIAYTMTREKGDYATLGENFGARDPSGEPASFLASEDTYKRVRRLVMENRVLPLTGDFGGTHALRAAADDMRGRGLTLGVFYGSNVEQYLFDGKKHPALITSITSMPRDDESRIVRVWFDQGAPPKAQHPRRRTTQLTIPVNVFLERASKKPFKTYAEVVQHAREAAN
jgi:hypothetical protein